MKHLRTKIVAIITALLMTLVFFAGCDCSGCKLFTMNNEKDMDQVIATVKTEDSPTEEVTKRELVMFYMQYASSLSQNGYSTNQAIELCVDTLVNNRIAVLKAMEYLNEDDSNVKDSEKGVYDVDRYLTEDDIIDQEYTAVKNINDLIESYVEGGEDCEINDHTDKEDKITYDTRALPKKAEDDDRDPSKEKKQAYILKGIDSDSCTHIRKAYNRLIKLLSNNGLIAEDFNYSTDKMTDTKYYTTGLKSLKENVVLKYYEKAKTQEIIKDVTFEMLCDRYEEMFNAQVNGYVDPAKYSQALSSAETSPVVYNPYTGYGYVYNLLFGLNDVQSAELNLLQKKQEEENLSTEDYQKARAVILNKTLVKDLRGYWLESGCDFDTDTNKFTGNYTVSTEGLPFYGTAKLINGDDADKPDYIAKFEVTAAEEFSLTEVIELIDEFLYNSVSVQTGAEYDAYKRAVKSTDIKEEFDERVQDLLFAFSTDGGSLNNKLGYVIAPKAAIGKTETYVTEFANASRQVITMGDGAYILVGTDYGYHMVFNAKTVTVDANYHTLNDYLDSLGVEKELDGETFSTWEEYYKAMLAHIDDFADKLKPEYDEDFYLYQLQQAYTKNLTSTLISNSYATMYKELREADGLVVIYEDRYKSLLDEKELKEEKANS